MAAQGGYHYWEKLSMQCRMAGSIITFALAILAASLTGHAPPLAKVPRVGILIPYIRLSAPLSPI